MTPSPHTEIRAPRESDALKRRVVSIAVDLGFDECRVAACGEAPHAGVFEEWLAEGCQGDMTWMSKDPHRRAHPGELVPGARSVITLALNYFQGSDNPRPHPGVIARYAWGDDYHDLIEGKLKRFDAQLAGLGGRQRCYVDTGPVLERDFAGASGLGWNGKSTVQIHPELGTWFFLAEIITTLNLAPDPPMKDHCGKCTRCIDVCPTHAITRPRFLDARRCISYLTIEHKGAIPMEFREAIGDRIYGCDDCLTVCPWNRFARASREATFAARETVSAMRLREFLDLDDEAFRALFRKSPIKRLKRPRFLRNVCVALGNVGTADDLPALETAAQDEDPLIAEHAAWAIERIEGRA